MKAGERAGPPGTCGMKEELMVTTSASVLLKYAVLMFESVRRVKRLLRTANEKVLHECGQLNILPVVPAATETCFNPLIARSLLATAAISDGLPRTATISMQLSWSG